MSTPVDGIFYVAGIAGVAFVVGASFTFGVAIICRWLKWAPINTVIQINGLVVPTETEV